MPTVEDLLGGLSAHPPTPPRPVGEVRARARRRVRRRRALVGSAVVLVVTAAGFGIGVAVTADDDPGQHVFVDGGPTTTAPPTTEPSATDGPLTLDPATGHDPGSVVRVEGVVGPLSSSDVGVTVQQCTDEVVLQRRGSDGRPFCTDAPSATDDGAALLTVVPTLRTPEGVVECKRSAGRCGVAVLDAETGAVRQWAELDVTATPVAEAGAVVVVDGDEGTVADGDTLLVTVTGVQTGDLISISQCQEGSGAGMPVEPSGLWCSPVRSIQTTVQSGPETQVTFTVFHDVYLQSAVDARAGWTTCDCTVLIDVAGDTQVEVPLAIEPTDAPIRPVVTLDPAGPVAPGSAVGVRATGLQPGSAVSVGICPVPAPAGGGAGCVLADGTAPPMTAVEADGTVAVPGLPLPGAGFGPVGEDSAAAPGRCVVTLDGGLDPAWAAAPIDLSG